MEYPQETIAIGAKGKKEARVLKSRGTDFVVYGYLDIGSGRMLGKYSILLRRGGGEVEHLFIVATAGQKELVVKHEIEKKAGKRGIFDKESGEVILF